MSDLITVYGIAFDSPVWGVVPCASREIAEGVVAMLNLRGIAVRVVQREYRQQPVCEWATVKGARNA